MTRKKPEVNIDQGVLFGALVNTGHGKEGYLAPPMPEPEPYERTTIGEPGSYVNLQDRAIFLRGALLALGKRNQRGGFAIAAQEEPYRLPIEERYEDDLPFVIKGARRNEDAFMLKAKDNFWRATGYAALRNTAREEGDENAYDAINARSRQQWREFYRKYSGTGAAAKRRSKYSARLKKDITRANREVKKRTKVAS